MNSKYLSLSKTKKYIQKKYLQFKEIRNPKRQTIYFVYYGTVGCFSIGIIADPLHLPDQKRPVTGFM